MFRETDRDKAIIAMLEFAGLDERVRFLLFPTSEHWGCLICLSPWTPWNHDLRLAANGVLWFVCSYHTEEDPDKLYRFSRPSSSITPQPPMIFGFDRKGSSCTGIWSKQAENSKLEEIRWRLFLFLNRCDFPSLSTINKIFKGLN